MVQFFAEDDWYQSYKEPHVNPRDWVKLYEIKMKTTAPHKGEVLVRIEHQRLYYLYKRYMREMCSASKVRNNDTFWKEMETLGIEKYPKRRNINGSKKTCVDIYFSDWKCQMGILYPGYQVIGWNHQSNHTEFMSLMNTYMQNSDYHFE